MPSPTSAVSALAALRAFLARQAVPAVGRGAVLAETVKAGDSRLYDLLRRSKVPEQALIEYGGHLNQALPNPKLVKLPTALRWESRGRDLYDPGVVHYDASGGSALPDILMGQPHYFQNDTDLPWEKMWDPLDQMLNRGQVRAGRLSDLDPERAVYVPDDPWAASRAPDLQGRAMFYPNLHEGRVISESTIPRRVTVEDILNDPALREELNLSVAVPEDSAMNRGSTVFKSLGGLVQKYKAGGRVKKPIWDKARPKSLGASQPLSSAAKSAAKAAAKSAGRPYPNLVDNMRAAGKI